MVLLSVQAPSEVELDSRVVVNVEHLRVSVRGQAVASPIDDSFRRVYHQRHVLVDLHQGRPECIEP